MFEPCRWSCGIRGHSSSECRQPKGVTPSAGNLKQLGAGAPSQQSTRAPPSHLRCRQVAASDAIKVAGNINGRQVEMVVDTGAERTFVREGVLPGRGVKCVGQQLCGVTGDCVPVKGPVWVNLAVGRVTERLPVLVAEMEDECLLGLDFLNRVGACVDLQEDVSERL
ncbi:uncharacterized protein LOC143028044 [Oratosquilla oratoria]|uniref:uncharacterized protein LOC143028044 n=1 Tax=Oratosquilla oratoria TaxID=337810 RepID=UPI003F76F8ED